MLALLLSVLLSLSSPEAIAYAPSDSVWNNTSIDSVQAKRVTIDKIFIIGNKKTRESIILRELSIKPGETYDTNDLEEILIAEKSKVTNLRLFTSVDITTLYLSPDLIDIVIHVSERWYIFPVPIFDLADRNFNDWWRNQNHDLSRANYGVKIFQNNFRGRNEALRVTLQFGYTKQFGLFYRIPYIEKSQRHGISLGFNYAENKNLAYVTQDHKQVFLDSEELLSIRKSFFVGYRFRNTFYTSHTADITYNSNAVNDTIITLNPNFYKLGEDTQEYFEVSYTFRRDKRDFISYPLKGNELDATVTKYGIGIFNSLNQYDATIQYTQYSDLGRNFYFANYSSVYLSGPEEQPYYNLGALGYKNDFVRGYELFLIEGQRYYLNRATFKKRLFAIKNRLNFMPLEQFRDFPLALYLKTYFDFAYVENIDRYKETDQNLGLSNRYLHGAGAGLDLVTSYDTVLRFEYSFTREGTSGFFFHVKKEF